MVEKAYAQVDCRSLETAENNYACNLGGLGYTVYSFKEIVI